MVVIRLSRGGTNKRPFYRIIVADQRNANGGSYLERVGYFNPIAVGGEKRLELNHERVNYWLSQGAQPSERVVSLLDEFDQPELLAKRKAKNSVRQARKKAKASAEAAPAAKEESASPVAG